MFALKQKKLYEKQLKSLEAQVLTLEQQKIALEVANIASTVVTSMRTGANAMKAINMDVDEVEDLRDDVAEQMDAADEINNALSQPMGEAIDEDEILGELDDLMATDMEKEFEATDADLMGVPSLPDPALSMPAAPSAKPVVATKPVSAEESELSALEMMM